MKNYKRQWRELSDEHREKISQSSKNRPKSAEHRQHISQAMVDYWDTVPNKPKDISMDEYLSGDNTTYQENADVKNNARER